MTNFNRLDEQGDEPEHFEDILGFEDEVQDESIFDTDEDEFDDDEDDNEDDWNYDDWPLDDDEFDDDDNSLFDIDDEGEIVDNREDLDVD